MYTRTPTNNNQGRTGYWKPEYVEQAYKLAMLGLTDKQMAEFWGLQVQVIDYWKQQKEDFRAALKRGKIEADAEVAIALHKKACGYDYEEELIFKNKAGEITGRQTVKKHQPADSWAALKWLAIRQRENWAEVLKTEFKVSGTFDVRYLSQELQDIKSFSTETLETALKLGIMKAADILPLKEN